MFWHVDSFLIWRLTGGKCHLTDATNASRTSLYNIHNNDWDEELLELFDVPRSGLPKVMDSADEFGKCDDSIFNTGLPIRGVAGDQQAAAIGQACFNAGDLKATYGTGCFVIVNTGDKPLSSKHKLLTTICYRLRGKNTYALEGSIFVSGALLQWLRDGMKLLKNASESEQIAAAQETNDGVYLVPALTGLGAPHWAPNARGAIYGITRATTAESFIRAALESIGYQTHDLLRAIATDGNDISEVRVDGGMTANNWLMQFIADIADTSINRPVIQETTAYGAALLALMQTDPEITLDKISTFRKEETVFRSSMEKIERKSLLDDWSLAVRRTLSMISFLTKVFNICFPLSG